MASGSDERVRIVEGFSSARMCYSLCHRRSWPRGIAGEFWDVPHEFAVALVRTNSGIHLLRGSLLGIRAVTVETPFPSQQKL